VIITYFVKQGTLQNNPFMLQTKYAYIDMTSPIGIETRTLPMFIMKSFELGHTLSFE